MAFKTSSAGSKGLQPSTVDRYLQDKDLKLAEKENHRQQEAVEAAYELGIGSCCKDDGD